MIPPEQLENIKGYLDRSENPLFFFDDDNDGLCSFILFRQFVDSGIGIPIKTHPDLSEALLNRVIEHNPDYIFILDKPVVSQDFLDQVNVPVIWLDHHSIVKRNNVKYYNPKLNDPNERSSTTYWAYKAVGGKLWIAAIGAVSDWTIPDFFEEFRKEYPDLVGDKKTPPELLYDTKFGKLCKIFSFLNKGKLSIVKKNVRDVLKIESPYDILDKKTKEGKDIAEQTAKIEKEYDGILNKALKTKPDGKLIIFTYSSRDLSLTSDLSNELLYKNEDKIIIVGREKDGELRMSLRSDSINIKAILEKALEEVDCYGGGHLHACGANVKMKDFNKFIDIIKKEISNQ